MNLPPSKTILEKLGIETSAFIHQKIEESFLVPLREFSSKPSKKFRAQMVALSAKAVNADVSEAAIDFGCELVESIHTGSLIIDDIEDDSLYRRGQPTLHRSQSLPYALNAGNWLYFWPLSLIKDQKISATTQLALMQLCHQVLCQAHLGQALDICTKIQEIPREEMAGLALTSIRLKSGSLGKLACGTGAVLAEAEPTFLERLISLGENFAIQLQKYDDLGNLTLLAKEKRFEDLKLSRPTYWWAWFSKNANAREWDSFLGLIKTFHPEEIGRWFKANAHLQTRALEEVGQDLEKWKENLNFLPMSLQENWLALADHLKGAYV